MKTLTTINNLKKLGTAVIASLILTTSGIRASEGDALNETMNHLEDFMTVQEQMIMYIAPVMIETEDASAAMERLENFVEMSEAALKYEAPEITEPASLEMEWLDCFIAASEASLKYEAPAEDIDLELERLDLLSASTEASLKYSAPVEKDATQDNVTDSDNLLAETK
jgi:hypothetical protein